MRPADGLPNGSCTVWAFGSAPQRVQDPLERELHDQIKAAPSSNRQFHASDLCRAIGQVAYDARVLQVIRRFGCPRFTAMLAVHG